MILVSEFESEFMSFKTTTQYKLRNSIQFPGIRPSNTFEPVSLFFSQFDFNLPYRLKTLFDLEWPILKCLHSGKECQVAYAKTYLNMQCNGKFGCALRNITSNVSVWNIEHRGLFLMKIHSVDRKLYQIINGGTTALVYDESYLTLRGMHSWLILCVITVFQQLRGW